MICSTIQISHFYSSKNYSIQTNGYGITLWGENKGVKGGTYGTNSICKYYLAGWIATLNTIAAQRGNSFFTKGSSTL